MPFDGLAVSVIVSELQHKLYNGRVMKIFQPERTTIVFHLRLLGQNTRLLVSANPGLPRIHTTTAGVENPPAPPAFCMLLRKHLEPARIVDIRQVEFERLIHIIFATPDANQGETHKTLVFELMGRHSNILLLDQSSIIIDALKRIPEESNRVRVIQPGAAYQAPPDQGKTNPESETQARFLEHLRLSPPITALSDIIFNSYQGFSPTAAKELVQQAGLQSQQAKGETQRSDWERLWQCFSALVKHVRSGGSPAKIMLPNGRTDFLAFAPVHHSYESWASLDPLLDSVYTEQAEGRQLQEAGQRLLKPIQTRLQRLKRKEERQAADLQQAEAADYWLKLGELLKANLHQVSKGLPEVTCIDYYSPEQSPIVIPLDPSCSPSENAQRYFKRYTKAKKGKKAIERQLRKTRQERAYLENVIYYLEQASSVKAIQAIEEELINSGYLPKVRSKQRTQRAAANQSQPMQFRSSDGDTILVGRNNRQNDAVTFRTASPDDIWLHAQKIPGSHVIIRKNGPVSDQTLKEAALLAAYYSQARRSPKVAVDYTERKHVRKPRGAPFGFVVYNPFSTILANPTAIPEKLLATQDEHRGGSHT